MQPRILIVEDEPILALDLKETLQDCGYAIVGICSSGKESIELCKTLHPQLVLMDIQLDDGPSGTNAAGVISSELDIPVVFLTSYLDQKSIDSAQAASPYGYLLKPFRPEILDTTLSLALTQHQRQRELALEVASLRQQSFANNIRYVRLSASTEYPLYSGTLIRDGAPVKLTPKEQKFLDLIAVHPDTLITFDQIYSEVWNSQETRLSALRTLLHRLRQKAGGAMAIESVTDAGYRLSTKTTNFVESALT